MNWTGRRKQEQWKDLVKKHEQIRKQGLNISARTIRFYTCKNNYKNLKLVRVQLCVEFLDGTSALLMSKCLVSSDPFCLEGQKVQFKFMPGDLSQIVLLV